jgi:hypothetical protein
MQAASASILALRDRVAATAADVSTISWNSIVHNVPVLVVPVSVLVP